MKINYENSLKMMLQCNNALKEIISKIVDNLPDGIIKGINNGKDSSTGHKKGAFYQFQDDGDEMALVVYSGGENKKELMSLRLSSISKKELVSWPEIEDEKLIGVLRVNLYKKDTRWRQVMINYYFNMKVVDNKYFVKITTDAKTQLKENFEILQFNNFEDVHRDVSGVVYPVDIKKVIGEERKINKLI